MLKKAGSEDIHISDNKDDILSAEKLILPGVGHFDFGMKKLHNSGLIPILEEKVFTQKVPILGICLGAQLITNRSDEGNAKGLGWVDAETVAFDKSKLPLGNKIPHMGWNYVQVQRHNQLFSNMYSQPRFYFVHSYHFKMNDFRDEWLVTNYGYNFCAAFQRENIFGCQFHPEKSHKFGLRLMENFVKM
jgi:glutamine amidotransferase